MIVLLVAAVFVLGAVVGAVLVAVVLGPSLLKSVPPLLTRVVGDAVASLGSEREWAETAKDLDDRLEQLEQRVQSEGEAWTAFQTRHGSRVYELEEGLSTAYARRGTAAEILPGARIDALEDRQTGLEQAVAGAIGVELRK